MRSTAIVPDLLGAQQLQKRNKITHEANALITHCMFRVGAHQICKKTSLGKCDLTGLRLVCVCLFFCLSVRKCVNIVEIQSLVVFSLFFSLFHIILNMMVFLAFWLLQTCVRNVHTRFQLYHQHIYMNWLWFTHGFTHYPVTLPFCRQHFESSFASFTQALFIHTLWHFINKYYFEYILYFVSPVFVVFIKKNG